MVGHAEHITTQSLRVASLTHKDAISPLCVLTFASENSPLSLRKEGVGLQILLSSFSSQKSEKKTTPLCSYLINYCFT